jgi:hypothetical protein
MPFIMINVAVLDAVDFWSGAWYLMRTPKTILGSAKKLLSTESVSSNHFLLLQGSRWFQITVLGNKLLFSHLALGGLDRPPAKTIWTLPYAARRKSVTQIKFLTPDSAFFYPHAGRRPDTGQLALAAVRNVANDVIPDAGKEVRR